MNPTRIGSLDFDDIKLSIKNYLANQTEFTDYNFEGAAISQLLNVLAYNSHYDSLSANFLVNEVFLDTAVKRSGVVSRAKELGYTPRSRRAATVQLTVTFTNVTGAAGISALTMPAGTRFTSIIGEALATFTTISTVIVPRFFENSQYVYRVSLAAYEGILSQETITYNSIDKTVSISNADIDTSTLKVEVNEAGIWVEYVKPSTLLTVGPTDKVYMIQEGFDGFEIYFGDGIFGNEPANASQIRFTYVVTSGIGNGALNFTLVSQIDNTVGATSVVLATTQSNGAALLEDVESVRFNALNQYGTQNRAVIASDYAALTKTNFGFVHDAFAWDGSSNSPPKFGKVMLCIQPTIGDILTNSQKNIVSTFLESKAVANTKIEFVDPEYVQIKVSTIVRYDTTLLNVGIFELEFIVKSAIAAYAQSTIQKFKGIFRSSNLARAIDSSNYAIISNLSGISLIKDVTPNIFSKNNIRFTYSNEMVKSSFISSVFFVSDLAERMQLKDDGNGKINMIYYSNGVAIVHKANIGSIDYISGTVQIDNLELISLEGLQLTFEAKPLNQDIKPTNNIILNLAQENIDVQTLADY